MKMKTTFFGGVVLAMVGAGSFAFADDQAVNSAKITEIKQQIQKQGAHWTARETWVSKLSKQDLQRMFGNNETPTSKLDYSHPKTPNTPPTSVDWRSQNGQNWIGPILNQGNCGSCVAFSTVGTLEAQVSISAGLPWLHPSFSADQMFECGGGGCNSGWTPSHAANFLKNTGIVDMACQPDVMGSTGNDISCSAATSCNDVANRYYKISGSTRPSGGLFGGGKAVDVETALTQGPLVTTLTVYTDFLTYSGGIYKHVSGGKEGGHAVSIVGYNATDRYWIIRNSWGADWGEGGFARISFDDESGVGASTWQFQLPTKSEYLTVAWPMENDYISGQIQAKIASSATADTTNVEVRTADLSSHVAHVITTLSCAGQPGTSGCISALDTTTLPDGRYEMVAKTANTNIFSQVRSFNVVNNLPTNLTITYTGKKVDLTKPLKGRIEFNVVTTTSSVPFQSVIMMVQQNGTTVTTREVDTVLPVMDQGLGTTELPNGTYQLFFRGSITVAGKVVTVDSPVSTLQFKN